MESLNWDTTTKEIFFVKLNLLNFFSFRAENQQASDQLLFKSGAAKQFAEIEIFYRGNFHSW